MKYTLRSKNLPLLATAENTPLCKPKKNTTGLKTLLALFMLVMGMQVSWGQLTYNFGTTTYANSSATTSSAGKNVFPAMSSGDTYIRLGTGSPSINLENQTIAFGTGSDLRMLAPTGTSQAMVKFSTVATPTPSTAMSLSFKLRIGISTGATGATTGTFNFVAGNSSGISFTTANASSNSEYGPFMKWVTATGSSAITWSTGANSTIDALTFAQGTSYNVEIFASGGATNYLYSGTSYSLAANTYDVWVGGVKKATAIAYQNTGITPLDSWMFFSTGVTSETANIFLDDFSTLIRCLICKIINISFYYIYKTNMY